ncbi:hypothetical protein A2U01_0032709, partial [Trifolium medium]|nr:hypothetical protein [Trifolium medium]
MANLPPPLSPPPVSAASGAAGSSLVPPPLRSASSEDSHRLKFTLQISDKLHDKYFHLWRQQVVPYINA